MKITNKLNLPEAIVNFVKKGEREYVEKEYHVTELLLPVREIILNRRHDSELEQDVSDYLPALFGTAVHEILESNTPLIANLYPEESISYDFMGTKVRGRIDILDLNTLTIGDYKTCSTNKIMKEDFLDWKMQGLIYALLVFKEKGIILRHLEFYALMKDWSKVKAASSSNYPASPIFVWKYDIQDSDYDFIDKWVREKLESIDQAMTSGDLPECTDEERWYTGTKYAVYKNFDDKRAAIVCDSKDEAIGYIEKKLGGMGIVDKRLGENIKCKYYCACSKFCKKGSDTQ